MKLTLSWLKDHLDTDASLDEIVERLTSIGLEVEHVDDKAGLKPFVIAKVLTAQKHPDADKLQVLTVDTGDGKPPVQVVCGAPNARAGLVGAFAAPGTRQKILRRFRVHLREQGRAVVGFGAGRGYEFDDFLADASQRPDAFRTASRLQLLQSTGVPKLCPHT